MVKPVVPGDDVHAMMSDEDAVRRNWCALTRAMHARHAPGQRPTGQRAGRHSAWLRDMLLQTAGRAFAEVVRVWHRGTGATSEMSRTLQTSWSGQASVHRVTPLRIGVRSSGWWMRALMESPTPYPVQWIALAQGRTDDQLINTYNLDACIGNASVAAASGPARGGARGVAAMTPPADAGQALTLACTFADNGHRGRGVESWASESPLRFTSLFPLAYDSRRIELSYSADGSAPLAALLLVRGMIESRTPMRIDLLDAVRGRFIPKGAIHRITPGQEIVATSDALDISAKSVIAELARLRGRDSQCLTVRAAARLASIWAADCLNGASGDERLEAARIAVNVAPTDVGNLLRCAAVEVAYGPLAKALDSCESAYTGAVGGIFATECDHLLHVQAELSAGCTDDLAMGRIAVGLMLAMLATPADVATYVMTDLLDELVLSEGFVGREQDRILIGLISKQLVTLGTRAQARSGEVYRFPQPSSGGAPSDEVTKDGGGVALPVANLAPELHTPERDEPMPITNAETATTVPPSETQVAVSGKPGVRARRAGRPSPSSASKAKPRTRKKAA